MSLNRRQLLTGFGLTGVLGLSVLAWQRRLAGAAIAPQMISSAANLQSPQGEPLLRFAAVADAGMGNAGQYAVANAMTAYRQQQPFSLVILAGDNIYTNGEIEKIAAVFERPYATLLAQNVSFRACLGNHDIRTANGTAQLAYPGFNLPARYHSFQQGPVQFFVLDTNNNADWTTQLQWLDRELAASTASWKIVFGHHQIYSSGRYGIDRQRRQLLVPHFRQHGVALYINGHEHHYERSQSLDGTTYLICGGGANLRPVGRSPWTAYATSQLSFAIFEVYADQIVVSGIGTDARPFDHGAIARPVA
ncbi:MAG: metallophosphoesterase [Spirulinaceae cyanobacterium SM2_1_0]|nr:metallophosphoesterase [Spirulinaceae cyanobacterium SM2_1_0]